MHDGERVRVVVELSSEEEPIEGTVETAAAPPRHFTGWMDLVALLDEARYQARQVATASSGPREGRRR